MTNDKRISLEKYVQNLRQRLSASVPEKHKNRPTEFREMLEIDLRKTLAKLEAGK